jgi:hypothetical protein
MVVKMTFYYINDKGLMQKQVGGQPPSDTFVGVSPDGMMRKYTNGTLTAAIPNPENPLKDIIEQKNAIMLLTGSAVGRKRSRKSKPKSKRKRKCGCK